MSRRTRWILAILAACPILSLLFPDFEHAQSIPFPGPGMVHLAGFNGFTHNRQITINPASTLVPSTQTNFAVLITGTLAYLAVPGSGGQIQHTTTLNGYTVPADLAFTSDAGCVTNLNWEVQPGYVTTTGAIAVWVNIPSLGTGTTSIWMCYNNAGVTTYQGSATSTWDTSYLGVWHMADNAATKTIVESTASAIPATNIANTSTKTTAGEFATGLTYNGTSDASSVALTLSTQAIVTLSYWLNWTTYAANDHEAFEYGTPNYTVNNGFVSDPNFSGSTGFVLGTGKTTGGTTWIDKFTRPSAGVWHYYSFVLNRTTPVNIAYVDGGAPQSLTTVSHTASALGNFDNTTLSFMSRTTSTLFAAGSLQEVRISTTTRTQDWSTTNFNNQSAPASFSTIGAEN
jgi:hypothetical protein